MKINILKIAFGIILLLSNALHSQTTINYSTFTPTSACNIFGVGATVNGIAHQTTFGQPTYNSSTNAVKLSFNNTNGDKGTEFKIAYNFKIYYTYKITVFLRNAATPGTTIVNPVNVRVSISDNGSSNNCNGPEIITGSSVGSVLTGPVSSTIFIESGFNFNVPLSASSSFCRIASIGSSSVSPAAQTIEINKVIIEEIPPTPNFTISPPSLSIPCGSADPVTFTCTNTYNTPNVSYSWDVGTGWSRLDGTPVSGVIISNPQNSIVLKPNTYPLSSISVIPVIGFNGFQGTRTSIVSLSPFNSSATISGTQNICTGTANYTIPGITAGQNVSWSLSNTATASIISSSNTGATVSFNGTGAQTLTATITNACNQSTPKTFVINSGSTTFTTTATLTGSTTAACSGTRVFSINNLDAGLTVGWSVSDTSVASLSGMTNTQATLTIIGNGSVSIIATITNSCGQSTTRTATLYGGTPVLTSFTCDAQGKPFCDQGQISEYTSNIPSLNIDDRVTAIFSGQTSTEANLNTNWEWQALNNKITLSGGTRSFRNVGCVTFGTTGLQVRAKNSCGWSDWFPLTWEIVEVPDPLLRQNTTSNAIVVYPNPSSSTWYISTPNKTIESILVTDVFGKKLYSTKPSENQV